MKRPCQICGARVRNINPKVTTCDSICTRAKWAKRTREQQIIADMETYEHRTPDFDEGPNLEEMREQA